MKPGLGVREGAPREHLQPTLPLVFPCLGTDICCLEIIVRDALGEETHPEENVGSLQEPGVLWGRPAGPSAPAEPGSNGRSLRAPMTDDVTPLLLPSPRASSEQQEPSYLYPAPLLNYLSPLAWAWLVLQS